MTEEYEIYTKQKEFDSGNFAIAAEKYLEILRNNNIILSYDENSILRLDSLFKITPLEQEDYFAFLMGSFLGEYLTKFFDKKWHFDEKQQRWIILFPLDDGAASVNVFKKVYARMKDKDIEDSAESISEYYRVTQDMIKNNFKLDNPSN